MITATSTVARQRRESLFITALTATAALAFTYVTSVRTPLGQALDTRAMLDISSRLAGDTWTTQLLNWITPLSVAFATAALAAVAARWHGRQGAFDVCAIAGGTILCATILKTVLVRPELLGDAGNSLPSGHVAAIAGLAVAAAMTAPSIHRAWAIAAGMTATGLTGTAAMALQWHRPSDVLAAVLVAGVVGALVAALPGARSAKASQRMRSSRHDSMVGRAWTTRTIPACTHEVHARTVRLAPGGQDCGARVAAIRILKVGAHRPARHPDTGRSGEGRDAGLASPVGDHSSSSLPCSCSTP